MTYSTDLTVTQHAVVTNYHLANDVVAYNVMFVANEDGCGMLVNIRAIEGDRVACEGWAVRNDGRARRLGGDQ